MIKTMFRDATDKFIANAKIKYVLNDITDTGVSARSNLTKS